MMRTALFMFACLFSVLVYAQKDSIDMNAPYMKTPGIPDFDLLRVDSNTHITKADLKLHHKTIIMFFSPECPHCQHQTEDMITGMDSLKDVQIVMATYQPLEELILFYKKYGLDKYSNIKVGRDTHYFFPPFYRMKSLPHLALYNARGTYVGSYEGNQKVVTLVNAFAEKK